MKVQYKMKRIEYLLIILFAIVLAAAIVFGLVLNMNEVSLVLIFIDFPLALIIAVYASLGIREEEETKTTM
jgi:ABC-type multidrug transport system permease subunit